jgi:isopentenyl phosphate kinase
MLGKVSEAREAVKEGVEVQFVNASKPDMILKALKGEPVAGTVLTG